MTQDKIFEIIKEKIQEVLPELDEGKITLDSELKALGANSVDRMEIIDETLLDLDIENIPQSEFGDAKTIQGVISVILNNAG